ncbi:MULTISPECIES: response regulator transcription factor [unclassified Undibacterium]|uniref:response regulator transcription factor n=1 Tax=unclassified Undibacterium TaxID=2630295 RepID=UPI002AC8D1D3|nr:MULTISPECIES: response regulator [unclassified Undibacterium]MEB0140085.1 response regulator [Undibacterium sp. CCC2.1]MEB0173195.1 response regulator [Undibacterium sp. CCC1.1]MEB0176944.1 response regulator [Undibacterium sp. CCC3.4]MEB0216277.1 response regulator [Undibacterium sp. 5I2]WPX44181.1 response regulator [Undibacterium sp. CCC3.4]
MKTKRILIVEDQADIRKLIRMTLDFGEYELHEADNGDSGYQMAQTVMPHIILLDVMMPGSMDGLQVCERLKKDPRYAATRIVMLTARGQQSDIDTGLKMGANSYMIKPFSPLELMDTVENYFSEIEAAGGLS